MRFLSPRHYARAADFVIPWGVGIFFVLVAIGEPEDDKSTISVAVGIALAVAQGLALRWRRSHPEAVMAAALAGGFGVWILEPDVVLPIAGYFALGALAARRPPRQSLPWLGALLALAAANFFTSELPEDPWFAMALAIAAWALGEAMRNRTVAIGEEAKRAVSEEQARIARELHDVIAHSVSVIVVQASAADDVFDQHPDQARASLRAIEESGREALAELRRLLDAVRPGAAEDPSRPQPGLDRLDELAAPLRASGLEVAVRREGVPPEVPAGVDLSAFRIVQEALTNTLRHARAGRADVTVTYGSDSIELDVLDDGLGAAANGSGGGHGLVGMRERAALLGGSLEAGPLAGGGYRVHAVLPLGGAA